MKRVLIWLLIAAAFAAYLLAGRAGKPKTIIEGCFDNSGRYYTTVWTGVD